MTRQIIIYRDRKQLAVVLEIETEFKGRPQLVSGRVATLPAAYPETARMLGEIVGAAYNVPTSWPDPASTLRCDNCADYGYKNERGQHVCRNGLNFDFKTYSYDVNFAAVCRLFFKR